MKEDYLMETVASYAKEYLDSVMDRPPFPDDESVAGLEVFDEPLPDAGMETSEILEMLHRFGSPATTAQTGGRFFGFVNGGLLPASLGAQWLVDTWNQNTALYNMSPAASYIEDVCEKWVVDLFGLPAGTALGLVTGSSNAMICTLCAARDELLRRQGWDQGSRGLRNSPGIRVVLGEGAHSAVLSALSVLGIGKDEMEFVPADSMGRMRADLLPALDSRTLLILQAGNVNGGAFDDFETLCAKGREAGTWIHIDGAFGMWAACSKKYSHLTRGIELADSWSTDAHKTLNAGYDCGLALCRDREAFTRAMQASGAYIAYGENRDNMRYTTEMSRRARGVILWAVLKSLGRSGVEALVDQLFDMTEYFASELDKAGREAGFSLVNPPVINQFMVKAGTPEKTRAMLKEIQSGGVCWCGGSVWEGEPVIRVSVCSVATTKEDIDMSVKEFVRAAGGSE